jgi:hypothetical protein
LICGCLRFERGCANDDDGNRRHVLDQLSTT